MHRRITNGLLSAVTNEVVAVERQRKVDDSEKQRQARRQHQRELGHHLSRPRTSARVAQTIDALYCRATDSFDYCETRITALPGTVITGRIPMKLISGAYGALVSTCVYNSR